VSGLNPLRIALSGFGGTVLAVALSGFVVEVDAPTPVVAPVVVSEGGGGHRRHQAQAAHDRRDREERLRKLRADDEAIIFALVAFVTGETDG
jgi:hypothetical protein